MNWRTCFSEHCIFLKQALLHTDNNHFTANERNSRTQFNANFNSVGRNMLGFLFALIFCSYWITNWRHKRGWNSRTSAEVYFFYIAKHSAGRNTTLIWLFVRVMTRLNRMGRWIYDIAIPYFYYNLKKTHKSWRNTERASLSWFKHIILTICQHSSWRICHILFE